MDWNVVELHMSHIFLLMLAVCTQFCFKQRPQGVFGAAALQLELACISKPPKNVSYSRAVVRYAEHLYIPSTLEVKHVLRQKMEYWKKTMRHVWSFNLPVIAHIHLQNGKEHQQ